MECRLPDWGYTTEELTEWCYKIAEPVRGVEPRELRVVALQVCKGGVASSKMLVTACTKEYELVSALGDEWYDRDVTFTVIAVGEPRWYWEDRLAALDEILERYTLDERLPGSDRLYDRVSWIGEVV